MGEIVCCLMVTQMKKILVIIALVLCFSLSGCVHKSMPEYLNPAQEEYLEVDSRSYKGNVKYQITDAYITRSPGKDGINLDYIDEHTCIMAENNDGKIEEIHRDDFLNNDGSLNYEAIMYVLRIKVTNIDAEYKHYKEDGYDTPYIFRADNLFLNFIDNKGKAVMYKTADYYSKRQEGDHTWSCFELQPGEATEYDIGFIVGSVYRDNSVNYYLDEYTPLISSMQGGLEQSARQYQVEWKDRS